MILPNDPETAIRDAAERIDASLIAIRRDIHAHPELGFEEIRTSGIVARELERLGIPHQRGIGKTGIVGLIEGGRPGPVLAIRADMDALPIQERTGLAWESTEPGKMHACGHDIHTTTLLGVAAVLKDLAPRLAGTVKLVFQPAEEGLGGMAAMIADGVMDAPHVDMALGFHNHPDMAVGSFGYVHGACLAAADRFEIMVHGRSGHAAYPHTSVDPIVAAATLVTQLQTVVSREVPPLRPAVVTVGVIAGGLAANIIPDSVEIKGTVRTLHPEVRDLAEAAIRRLAAGIAEGMRVRCEVAYRRGTPPLGQRRPRTRSCRRLGAPPIRRCGLRGRGQPGRGGFRPYGRPRSGVPAPRRLRCAGASGQAAQFGLPARRAVHRLRGAGIVARGARPAGVSPHRRSNRPRRSA